MKPIGTIKFFLETLRNFKNQGDVKKSKEVNTKYCFRRNIEDYIADKGKKSGADYLAHFDGKLLIYSFNKISRFDFHLHFLSILDKCDFIN